MVLLCGSAYLQGLRVPLVIMLKPFLLHCLFLPLELYCSIGADSAVGLLRAAARTACTAATTAALCLVVSHPEQILPGQAAVYVVCLRGGA